MSDVEIVEGRYVAEGHVPIVVTDAGNLTNGMHTPWVHYRLDTGHPDEESRPVLRWDFVAMLIDGAGYRPEPSR